MKRFDNQGKYDFTYGLNGPNGYFGCKALAINLLG